MSPAKKNFIANTFSIVSRTIVILLLIPFYIKYLGTNLYSDWIVLYSIPAIFEITNFGISQAVNNTFSINFNQQKSNSDLIINTGLIFTSLIGVSVIMMIFFLWDYLNIHNFLNLIEIVNNDSKLIVCVLTLKVFFEMIKGSLGSYLFAQNLNHLRILINISQYIFETLLIITLIIYDFKLLTLSLFLLIPPLLSCLILITYNYLKFKFRVNFKIRLNYLKLLFKPGFSFSLLSISQYFLNQGFIIVLKKYFGSEELIIFNSAKTLTNYLRQIQIIFASSVYPVFNIYFSKGQVVNLKKLFNKTFILNLTATIAASSLLIILGNEIWNLWIGNSIKFNKLIFQILILIQVIGSLFLISEYLIISTNKHFKLSIIFFFSSLLSVLSFYVYNIYFFVDFSFIPLFYLVHQVPVLIYCSFKIKSLIS